MEPMIDLRQTAPFPDDLADLVEGLVHRPGWTITLEQIARGQGCSGLTLAVIVSCTDSYDHSKTRRVAHYMPVPAAAYNRASWQRWLFDQLGLIDDHERAEFFTIDGYKPYAPNHGPGEDPYAIRELTTDEARRTSFTGQVKP